MELLRAGHAARKKLDALQSEIAVLKTEAKRIEKAPLALEDVRANVRREVERAAGAGYIAAGLRGFAFRRDASLPDLGVVGPWGAIALLLGPEATENAIVRLIEAQPLERGLQATKRAATLAEIATRLRDLERREELLTLELENAGHVLLRRPDCDPHVLMAVWQEKTPPTAAPAKQRPGDAPRRLSAINDGVYVAPPMNLEGR